MKHKFLLVLSLVVVFIVSITCSVVMLSADSKNYEWDEIVLDNEYFVGESFSAPNASVSLDGEKYDAKYVLKFPDGKAYADEDGLKETIDEFTLTQTGIYKINYSANVKGDIATKTVEFSVNENLYSVTSDKSTLFYGEVSHVDYKDVSDPTDDGVKTKTGLSLKLASGDLFNYNKVINLNKTNSLQNVFTFSALPQVDRELDVSGVELILTDAYDPSNTVEIKIKALLDAKAEADWNWTYISACAPSADQMTTGYAPGANPPVQVDTIFGCGVFFSFYGSSWDKGGLAIDKSLTIQYDYNEKAVYANNSLVVDLDDPYFFGQKLWSGFTTGEVFLSLKGSTYYKDCANLLITEVDGNVIGENEILNKQSEVIINVEDNGIDQSSPISVVGYKFPIFNATAIDVYDGVLPVTVKAFYGYYSNNKIELDITDNCFVADKTGVVTLEYSAIKHDGTLSKKTIDVIVKKEKTISIKLKGTYVNSGISGDIIDIANYIIDGVVGKKVVKEEVFFNGTNVTVTDGKFKVIKKGIYTVKVSVIDSLGQLNEVSYDVTIGANLTPVFLDDAVVPKYFIVGQKYILPKLNAYDYSHDDERIISTKIRVNGADADTFTPQSEGDVLIEYVAQTESGSNVKAYNAKAIAVTNDKGLDFTKYFICSNNGIPSAQTDGVKFSVQSSALSFADFTFINYLSAYDFAVEFAINGDKRNFDFLTIHLQDAVSAEDMIKVSINTQSREVYINDELSNFSFDSSNLFDNMGKTSAAISFNGRNNILRIGSSDIVLDNALCFSENLLKMTISMEGINGESEFVVRKICNQVLKSSIRKDVMAPSATYNGKYDVYYSKDDVLTVYKIVAADVLNPISECLVSVKTPSGDYAVALDETVLNKVSADRDYQVNLTSYGTYKVEYSVKDTSGQKATGKSMSFEVIDKEPPVLTILDELPSTAKIGEEIELPDVSATDNVDKELKITVILWNSYDCLRSVLAEDVTKITLTKVATYYLSFVCYDAAGNVATKTVSIKVEK